MNDYRTPTEVREEVVQGICEAFLAPNCWSVFHPFTTSSARAATLYITKSKRAETYSGFRAKIGDQEDGIRIRGVEMERAFAELRKRGYHIWLFYEFGSWLSYKCTKTPYYNGGDYRNKEVGYFVDRID